MIRPFFLTRASIGLAAVAAEQAVALPGKAIETITTLPAVPVRIAGGLVQSYLHAGQTLTDLAVRGDKVIESVFPARSDQPEWATFDEDVTGDGEVPDVSYEIYGSRTPGTGGDDATAGDDPTGSVSTGSVRRRR